MDDKQPAGFNHSIRAAYFTAGPWKLALLSLCSFGLYQWAWMYANWKAYGVRTGRGSWAFVRTLFAPLLAHSFFSDVTKNARAHGVAVPVPAAILAVAYFLLWAAHFLPGAWDLIGMLSFVPLLVVNALGVQINRVAYPGARSKGLSFGNYVVIFFGGMILALILYNKFASPMYAGDSGGLDSPQLEELRERLEMLKES